MCIFCKIIENKIKSYKIYENDKIICILDAFPIQHGHVLIISKKHYDNILEIDKEIMGESYEILKKIYKKMCENLKCKGFNFFTNTNKVADQEIMHFHWHIVPRYENQVNNSLKKRKNLLNYEYIELQNKLKIN